MNELLLNQLLEKLDKILEIDDTGKLQGIKISGQGILIKELNKVVEKLDRIGKYVYFIEEKLDVMLTEEQKMKLTERRRNKL